jgi:Tfp pilus assembly protein PilO
MSRDRLWAIAAVAGMLVVAIAGWFLGIAPVLQQGSAADAQTASITATNTASAVRLASLKSQFAHIKPLQAKLAVLRQSIPEDAGASVFLQEINTLTAKYGVSLTSVAINSATVYQAPVAATPATTDASGSTSTSTPTPTPTPTPTTTTTTPAAATGVNAFVLVPVSITVSGAFDAVRDFIGAIQSGPRLYLATSVSIGGATSGNPATGTLAGDIFTLQGSSPSVPPAKVKAPTPTPTPTATPTPTGVPTSTATPTSNATPKP